MLTEMSPDGKFAITRDGSDHLRPQIQPYLLCRNGHLCLKIAGSKFRRWNPSAVLHLEAELGGSYLQGALQTNKRACMRVTRNILTTHHRCQQAGLATEC